MLELAADTPKCCLGLVVPRVSLVAAAAASPPWLQDVFAGQCLHPESCVPGSVSPGFSHSPGDQALGVSTPFGSPVTEHFLLLAVTITGASPRCPTGKE